MDRACRSHAGTVELQRMAVVRGLSRTLLMPLFHKPDCGNGLCFEQGQAEHGSVWALYLTRPYLTCRATPKGWLRPGYLP